MFKGSTMWAGVSIAALLALAIAVLAFVLNRGEPTVENIPATDKPLVETPATQETETDVQTGLVDGSKIETPVEEDPTEETVASPEPEELPELINPSFDIVRVEPGGSTVIAGKSGPGYDVKVMIDDREAFSTKADNRGDFVAIFDVVPEDFLREVSLVGVAPDGREALSLASVFLTPPTAPADAPVTQQEDPEPVTVAAASPETDAAAQDTAVDLAQAAVDDAKETAQSTGPSIVLELDDDAQNSEAETKIGSLIPSATQPTTPSNDLTQASPEASSPIITIDQQSTAVLTAPVVDGNTDAPKSLEAPTTPTDIATPSNPARTPDPETETPRAPGVIIADADGIRVLQTPQRQSSPKALTNIVLDSISYDAVGDVAVSGRARLGNFVRIYVNNEPVKTESISQDGSWRAKLP